MNLPSEAVLLRIFCGESDAIAYKPLYEVIVEEARKRGMASATVIHGVMGFGKTSRIHTSTILRLSEDFPMIVEIVDNRERIEAFLPDLDAMINDGLVTLETIKVITCRHRKSG